MWTFLTWCVICVTAIYFCKTIGEMITSIIQKVMED